VGEVETVVDSSPVPVGDPVVVEEQLDPQASVAKPDSVPPRPAPRLWIWAIAAAALVFSAGVFLSGKFRPSNGPKSILVRTFIPTGLAAEEEWYADSLTQQVISTLAQGGKVNVRPFSTSLALKGKVESAREIGKRYGVDAVLEGSVRRSGSQLHISVQLVDTSTERILWSHEDDREASDLSSIEKSILSSIAQALQFRMEGTATVASRQPPKDRETYHLYLKANVITDQYRPEAESAVLYREVIRREPAFAPAHARLASVLARGAQGDLRGPDLTEAKQAAERAIGLDPTSAEAHTALAHVYMKAWKWAEAEPEFRTALTLDPNLAETRQLYGLFLASQGRFVEAIEQADRAVDLAPTSPTVWYAWAQVRLHARRFDDVIDGSKRAIELDRAFSGASRALARAYSLKGLPEKAIEAVTDQKFHLLGDNPELWKAYFLAQMGRKGEASELIRQWEATRTQKAPLAMAKVLALLASGEVDRGFETLENSVKNHVGSMFWLKVTPELEPYRQDARYQKAVALMDERL
jgi:TolB-like protein/Tfp pilus assembly protein PilF